ncbi:MAG: tyrosine-type recombinase/integrase [Bacteroidota bacterium]
MSADPSITRPAVVSVHEALPRTLPAGIASEQQNLIPLFLLRYDRENTRRSYAKDLERFFGSNRVSLADAERVAFPNINAHIEQLQSEGYAPSTLRRHVASLRGFFAWLIALGAIDTNPADRHLVRRIARSGGSDRVITVLSRDQARRLVETVDMTVDSGVRDRALLLTLLYCVLRRSEAAAMNYEHIQPVGRYWVLELPSTKGGANQFVKVPVAVQDAIHDTQRCYGWNKGPIWRSLSNNSRGRRLSPSSIYRIVSKAATRAGIQAVVGAHTLRHTGCTLAIEAGATVQQVQTHARHKNLETTMMYVHQRDKLGDSAADYINLGPDNRGTEAESG